MRAALSEGRSSVRDMSTESRPGVVRVAGLGLSWVGVEASTMRGAEAVAVMRGCFHRRNRGTADLLRAMHVAGRATAGTGARRALLDDFSGDEVAGALGWSRSMASRWLDLADDLVSRLCEVLTAMDGGALDDAKARVVSEWTRDLSDDHGPHDGKPGHGVRIPVARLRATVYLRLLDGFCAGLDDDALVTALVAMLREPDEDGPGARPPDRGPDGPDGPSDDEGTPDEEPEGPSDDPHGSADDTDEAGDGDDAAADDPGPHGDGPGEPGGAGEPVGDARSEPHGASPDGADADGSPDLLDDAPPTRGLRQGTVEVRLRLSTALGLDDLPARIPGWGVILAHTVGSILRARRDAEWRIVVTDDQGRLLHVLLTRRRPGGPCRARRGQRTGRGIRRTPGSGDAAGCPRSVMPPGLGRAHRGGPGPAGDPPARRHQPGPLRHGARRGGSPPATGRARPMGAGPGPVLRRPRLPTAGRHVRPRPHARVGVRWPQRRVESRRSLPPQSPRQARGRVAAGAARAGVVPLEQSGRRDLHGRGASRDRAAAGTASVSARAPTAGR